MSETPDQTSRFERGGRVDRTDNSERTERTTTERVDGSQRTTEPLYERFDRAVKLGEIKLPPSLLSRVISGAVFIAIILGSIWISRYTTAIIMAFVAGIAAFEFYRMMKLDGKNPNMIIGVACASLYPLTILFGSVYINIITLLMLVALCLDYVIVLRTRIQDIALTIFGALYTGLMLSSVVLIRQSYATPEQEFAIVLLTITLFLSVWINDSFAYLIGSTFGKHRLVPKISPAKSWEGFLAGVCGSVIVWLCCMFIPGIDLKWHIALIGGVACGVVGVIGDLVESRIKRSCGVKDAGTMIPGHGGMLDRIDSQIFVMTTAYFVLRFGGVL